VGTYLGSRRQSSDRAPGERGVESLPAVLLLSAIMAALTAGVMVSGIGLAGRTDDARRATQGFEALVNAARLLCSGAPGSSLSCRVDVGSGVIRVEGRKVSLVLRGNVVREATVPVPFDGGVREIGSGEYVLTLVSGWPGEEIRIG
jgi:hypothetical protein